MKRISSCSSPRWRPPAARRSASCGQRRQSVREPVLREVPQHRQPARRADHAHARRRSAQNPDSPAAAQRARRAARREGLPERRRARVRARRQRRRATTTRPGTTSAWSAPRAATRSARAARSAAPSTYKPGHAAALFQLGLIEEKRSTPTAPSSSTRRRSRINPRADRVEREPAHPRLEADRTSR